MTTRAQQARWEQFKNPQPGVMVDVQTKYERPAEPLASDTIATWGFWLVCFTLLLVGFLSSTRAGRVHASASKRGVRWIRAARQAFGAVTPTKIALAVGSFVCAVALPYLAWSTATNGTWEIKGLAHVSRIGAVDTHLRTRPLQSVQRLRRMVRRSAAIQIHQ